MTGQSSAQAKTIRTATPSDLPAVASLLTDASLPLDGMQEHFDAFLVAGDQGRISGAVGMEYYGTTGLLRSLVVAPDCRSSGLGSALHDALLTEAKARGVREVVLLTTTAAPFFAKKGFRPVAKGSVQGAVTASAEFAGACPSSATVMRRSLGGRVLVLCTGNACRSQMAAAFLRSFDRWLEVFSAGVSPAAAIHPLTVEVMQEVGISLGDEKPKHVELFLRDFFDFVITVCDTANSVCPVFAGDVRHRIHIGFEDPSFAVGPHSWRLARFRSVRDEIRTRMLEFYTEQILAE